jgi:hypothetical protein
VSLAEDDAYVERLAALAWLIVRLRMRAPRALARYGWRLAALAPPVQRLAELPAGTPLWFTNEPWSRDTLQVARWARIDGVSVRPCDAFDQNCGVGAMRE